MKHIILGLPPEIMDALQHMGGRDDTEIRRIICEALRNDFNRRAKMARDRGRKSVAA